MAPEIFSMKKYDKKVDIWALGVLIFTMIFGHVPFKALNMEAEINDKCHDGFDISFCKKKENSSLDQKKIKILNRLFRHVFMINP
jgi:serine/threonine protein kinase